MVNLSFISGFYDIVIVSLVVQVCIVQVPIGIVEIQTHSTHTEYSVTLAVIHEIDKEDARLSEHIPLR